MDGAIRLYQDADLKGDVWQCRLCVPGVSKPDIHSTKTFRDFLKDFMKDKDHLLSIHRKKLHKGTAG